MDTANDILDYWFGDALSGAEALAAQARRWFGADPAHDAELRARFGDLVELAGHGGLDHWRQAPESALALVLLLDQLPRNLYRGSGHAFSFDSRALSVTRHALDQGFDTAVHPVQAVFFYLPLEHAEDFALQDESVACFEALLAETPAFAEPFLRGTLHYAYEHRELIHRFGRFPHRNALLGRLSSPDELDYLNGGSTSFGATAKG